MQGDSDAVIFNAVSARRHVIVIGKYRRQLRRLRPSNSTIADSPPCMSGVPVPIQLSDAAIPALAARVTRHFSLRIASSSIYGGWRRVADALMSIIQQHSGRHSGTALHIVETDTTCAHNPAHYG